MVSELVLLTDALSGFCQRELSDAYRFPTIVVSTRVVLDKADQRDSRLRFVVLDVACRMFVGVQFLAVAADRATHSKEFVSFCMIAHLIAFSFSHHPNLIMNLAIPVLIQSISHEPCNSLCFRLRTVAVS